MPDPSSTHDPPAVEAAGADASAELPFVYLGRQPILDRDGAITAYELLFRASPVNRAEVTDDGLATAQVIVRALGNLGVQAVLGQHAGYVNVGRDLLFDDILYLLSPACFVLEVLEHVRFDEPVRQRVDQLRRRGFRIALDDVVACDDAFLAALPHADIVKVDLLQVDRAALPGLAATVIAAGKQLVAEKVETREDFDLTFSLGFHLFQGYFFARPQVLSMPRTRSSQAGLTRLLTLVASHAGVDELETELKAHPGVVVQLLRLVNSSTLGLTKPISSLREAVLAAGRRRIARWTQLLLYASDHDLPWGSDPLVQLAGTRACFMELAARALRPDDAAFADAAFMTGVFSLLHVLVDSTGDDALGRLGLAQPIRDAVGSRDGDLGVLLRIALAVERGDDAGAQALVAAQGGAFAMLTPARLAELNLGALAWFTARGGI
ncbi:diguanylate phosphodiesterase [Burkholderia sp. WAC0059]|uniref:EAL and HDOD domain-containing protein n=1 Tax=Burkholderia sp. WAC0059 TaxID=2066022 RepID=UPI000C7EA8C0|nr:EAL domain-containing protein [Burkholderia sp. WAC0059]PLZ04389.1 diguanylate phosphodiesterase [Burkholderia sp. WAC0059]